jgi:hypothetical protein
MQSPATTTPVAQNHFSAPVPQVGEAEHDGKEDGNWVPRTQPHRQPSQPHHLLHLHVHASSSGAHLFGLSPVLPSFSPSCLPPSAPLECQACGVRWDAKFGPTCAALHAATRFCMPLKLMLAGWRGSSKGSRQMSETRANLSQHGTRQPSRKAVRLYARMLLSPGASHAPGRAHAVCSNDVLAARDCILERVQVAHVALAYLGREVVG